MPRFVDDEPGFRHALSQQQIDAMLNQPPPSRALEEMVIIVVSVVSLALIIALIVNRRRVIHILDAAFISSAARILRIFRRAKSDTKRVKKRIVTEADRSDFT
ncbi:hypothetical protein [Afipia carboxidovorans]|uniref:hypothetical protein n=1 Tax=Afipia carboxidovorans TaxID=40137 RepID=UPI00308DC72B|nr:hypothetical protein CRBSH125_05740 [Afipia carboxidovorans]